VAQKINALAAPNELVGLSAIWLSRVPILTVQEALSQRSVATYQPSSPNLSAIGRYCCKSRKSNCPEIPAKVDFWTFLPPVLHRPVEPAGAKQTSRRKAATSVFDP
jgi:hypothetical protein